MDVSKRIAVTKCPVADIHKAVRKRVSGSDVQSYNFSPYYQSAGCEYIASAKFGKINRP